MIVNANKLNSGCTYEDIVEEFCDRIQRKILRANENGAHKTCFSESPIRWDDCEQEFKWSVNGKPFFHFDDYKEEVAERFIKAGYRIKPTGYIGGVWQESEDIYW